MSSADEAVGGSWPTNYTKSVTPAQGVTDDPGGLDVDSAALDPEAVVARVRDELPHLVDMPITREDGTRLRESLVEEYTEQWSAEAVTDDEDAVHGESVTRREPLTVGAAVADLMKSHRDTLRTTLNFERGRPSDPEYATFDVDAEDRWLASYQTRTYAQLRGWFREIVGGERPSGGMADGAFEEPAIALLSLSASSVPGGSRLALADHNEAVGDAWSECYDTLRNTMRAAGLDADEWHYDRREEPHTGKRGGGANRGYGHWHAIVVFDAAALDDDSAATPELFRPVVEKHVEACEYAGVAAHDLDVDDWDGADEGDAGTVVVTTPGELDAEGADDAGPAERVARYVADYCAVDPVDLSERSADYIVWAATKHALNRRTWSRSDAAHAAATADACQQRAESGAADQTAGHGECLVRSERSGVSVECAECGSSWGIDQSRTLARARLDAADGDGGRTVVADGGRDVETREDRLRSRWEDARSAAVVGETSAERDARERVEDYLRTHPGAEDAVVMGAVGVSPAWSYIIEEVRWDVDRSEVVGFERGPSWRLDSVTVGEEEYSASSGGSVEMVAVGEAYPTPDRGDSEPPAELVGGWVEEYDDGTVWDWEGVEPVEGVEYVLVRVDGRVGEVMGVDLRDYHLGVGDRTLLPRVNAEPLVEKGAVEVLGCGSSLSVDA